MADSREGSKAVRRAAWVAGGCLFLGLGVPGLGGARASAADCNLNAVEDGDELRAGSSSDCDGNLIPDECDVLPTFRLHAPRTYRTGAAPRFLAAADLEGDGDVDFLSSDRLGRNLTVLRNLGGAAFSVASVTLDFPPEGVAAADFDGDGSADLAVADGASQRLVLLRGKGAGGFEEARSLDGAGSLPWGVLARDLDADGHVDLASTGRRSDDVTIWLGGGDGSFELRQKLTVGRFPLGLASGDLDGDGDVDLAVVDGADGDLVTLRNTGGGAFVEGGRLPLGGGPESVAAGDLDLDGDLDLVASNREDDSLTVLLNSSGEFTSPGALSVSSRPRALSLADLDGDGDLDLAAACGVEEPGNLNVFLNDGSGNLTRAVAYTAGADPRCVVAADADGDGDLDLLVADQVGDRLALFLNRGDARLAAPAETRVGEQPFHVVAGDLDGDGRADLAVTDVGRRSLFTLRARGDGGFEAPAEFSVLGGARPRDLESADLDGDGDLDLALAAAAFRPPGGDLVGRSGFAIFRNDGGGAMTPSEGRTLRLTPWSLALSDHDGDGFLDILAVLFDRVGFYPGNGRGEFDEVSILDDFGGLNFEPGGFASADLNGDGARDLVVGRTTARQPGERDNVRVLMNLGDGMLNVTFLEFDTGGANPLAVVSADFDDDDRPDIATANHDSSSVGFLRNTGRREFLVSVLDEPRAYPVAPAPVDLLSADLDGDGDMDLATASSVTASVSVLLNLGRGTFIPAGDYGVGAGPSSLAAADMDADGDLDLVVVSSLSGLISVLWNDTAPAASPDADGDGRPDSCGLTPPGFQRGDVDGDGELNVTDAIIVLLHLFSDSRRLFCRKAADADDDGRLVLTDAVRIIAYLFWNGEPLPAPFRACGADPTEDSLSCRRRCAESP